MGNKHWDNILGNKHWDNILGNINWDNIWGNKHWDNILGNINWDNIWGNKHFEKVFCSRCLIGKNRDYFLAKRGVIDTYLIVFYDLIIIPFKGMYFNFD